MFDFLRNLTKSAEEKRQETVAAYLDGALNNRARLLFEQEMAQDAALQAKLSSFAWCNKACAACRCERFRAILY